jgi:hypothetical protein
MAFLFRPFIFMLILLLACPPRVIANPGNRPATPTDPSAELIVRMREMKVHDFFPELDQPGGKGGIDPNHLKSFQASLRFYVESASNAERAAKKGKGPQIFDVDRVERYLKLNSATLTDPQTLRLVSDMKLGDFATAAALHSGLSATATPTPEETNWLTEILGSPTVAAVGLGMFLGKTAWGAFQAGTLGNTINAFMEPFFRNIQQKAAKTGNRLYVKFFSKKTEATSPGVTPRKYFSEIEAAQFDSARRAQLALLNLTVQQIDGRNLANDERYKALVD